MSPRVGVGCLVAGLASILAPHGAAAQTAPGRRAPTPWTLGVYAGGSTSSPAGTRWGTTPDRRHVFLGLHATVPIVERRRWSFHYAPELVPLLIVSNNPLGHQADPDARPPLTGPVFAVGLAPIGLEGHWDGAGRWRVYGAGALGGLWFSRPAPVVNARAFNFTFEFGGGLLWRFGSQLALRTGYKFHHFSNAKTASENPGVDAHVFLAGLERSFGPRRVASSTQPQQP